MSAVATERIEMDSPTADSGRAMRPQKLRVEMMRRPLVIVPIMYLAVLATAAFAAPLLAPHDPLAISLAHIMEMPSWDHPMGTDPLGRDVLSRIMYGGRVSLLNATLAAATYVAVGLTSGLLAGYLGGWPDRMFTWLVDVVIAIPGLIVLLALLAMFGSNMLIAMVALGVLSAPGFARVIRGVTMSVREELYVAAAKVCGLPNWWILTRHVLPRVTGPTLVHGSLFCGTALLIDGGLAYLGFGAPPPTPTWGGMIVEASSVVQQQPWLLVPPGVVLAGATLAFALLGDAVRDARAVRTGGAERGRQVRARLEGRRTDQKQVASSPGVGIRDGSGGDARSTILSVENLTVVRTQGRGAVPVIQDVSLSIGAGGVTGVVGESGCGKSMTASSILGLLPPNCQIVDGEVIFDGKALSLPAPVQDLKGLRGREMALVGQEPVASLDPVFTVGSQLIELIQKNCDLSKNVARHRAIELLSDVRLPDPERQMTRYPHELSGGMAQRVGIALALTGNPKLLIADEPTTALDVTVQAEILDLIRLLQRDRGMAVLLISHDLGVIKMACDRTYVMYAGQIVESGETHDILNRPKHPYTGSLVKSVPRSAAPGEFLPTIPGSVPTPGEWPDGCHFADRCSLRVEECMRERIPLARIEKGRFSRCLRHGEL